jgi:peptidyl-prolyl cis-trans isomerase D
MMMDWITKKAKYFVIAMGATVCIAMVFMGPPTDQGIAMEREVGNINGKSISLESFQRELNFYQEQERNRSGQTPSGLQLTQLRKQAFDYKVQEFLFADLFKQYQLYVSPEEMWDHLINNPIPAIQQDSNFQTNGSFDKSKYIAWLSQEQTLNLPLIRTIEMQMKTNILPSLQLSQLFYSQQHTTDLEMAYDKSIQNNKIKFVYYKIPDEDMSLDSSFVTEEKIQEYYQAHPDSFYYSEKAAKLGYISTPIHPSREDSLTTKALMEDIEVELSNGTPFEDLAASYSDDASSARNGGKLGGFRPKEAWIPAFGEAAFALKKGEISKPVLTQFGYHLIQCNDVKGKGSKKKMDLSHILIRVTPSPETTDSLAQVLESYRQEILDNGFSLQEYAKESGLEYSEPSTIQQWNFASIQGQYIPGLHSFSFEEESSTSAISQVLQTEQNLYLFERKALFPKGRNLERSRSAIASRILSEEKRRLAKQALIEQEEAIRELSTRSVSKLPKKLGQAHLDTTDLVSTASWIPGIGHNQAAVYTVAEQPEGTWSPILELNDGVIMGNILVKEKKDLQWALETGDFKTPEVNRQKIMALQNQWVQSLVQFADVTNNLDAIYKN